MKYSKFLVTLVVSFISIGSASASTFQMMLESEADLGSDEELLFISHASFPDLINGSSSGSNFSPIDIIGAYSTTGLTWDGTQYIQMLESEADLGSGEELLFISHNNYQNLIDGNSSGSNFSPIDIIGAFSTTGLTWDGTQYIQMLESEADLGSGEELLFLTFETFQDLIDGSSSSSSFSPIDIIGAFSTSGLTWDGSHYVQMLESEDDRGSGEELLFITFDSFEDLVNGSSSGSHFSPIDIIGDYSTTGLASSIPNPNLNVPSPASMGFYMLGLVLLVVGLKRSRRDQHDT